MSLMPSPAIEPGVLPAESPLAASPSKLAKVLVIDDEEVVAHTLSVMLKADGFDVAIARSGEEGVGLLRGGEFNVVITDLVMPGLGGIQTLEAVREINPDIPVMILTGYATVNATIAALRHGACDFLLKPLSLAQLRAAVARALASRRPKVELPPNDPALSILAALQPEDRTAAALKLAKRTMRASAAAIAVIPREGEELLIELSKDSGSLTPAVVRHHAKEAFKHGEPIYEPLCTGNRSPSKNGTTPPGSVLIYPLASHGTTYGALMLWRDPSLAEFSAFDVTGGKVLAEEIAVALDDARLSSGLRHKVGSATDTTKGVHSTETVAKAVIATSHEAIVLLDKSGVVQDCNPAAEKTFGVPRRRAVGRKFSDFAFPPAQAPVFDAHLDKAYREGRDPHYGPMKVLAVRGNGEEFPIEISTAAIEAPQGRLLSTFGRDITVRMQAFDALRASEEQFRQLAENINTIFFICEPDPTRITYMSPAYDVIWGRPRQECLERPDAWMDAVHSDDRSIALELFAQANQGKQSSAEYRILRPDGAIRHIHAQVFPVRDDKGTLSRLVGILEDITERKQAERVLADAEAHFHTLFASSPLPTFLVDAETFQYLEVNDAAATYSGYARSELLQMKLTDLLLPEVAPRVKATIHSRPLHTQWHDHGRHRLRDGREVEVEVDVHIVEFRGRKAVLSVIQDVTARNQGQAEMAKRHRLATLVADIGLTLTRSNSLRKGLQECAEIFVNSIGAAFTRVWTVNEVEKVLELQASAGMYTHIDGGHARVPLGRFKVGQIGQSGAPYFTNSLLQDPELEDRQWAQREDLVAFAGYPLKVGERVLGVVAAFTREPMTEAIQQAFTAVAPSLAQFIERRRGDDVRAFLVSLVESSQDGIMGISLDGTVISWNHGAEGVYGYADKEMVGKSVSVLIPPDRTEELTQLLERVRRGERINGHETVRLRKDGGRVDISLSLSPILDTEGKITGAAVIAQDITERKRAEVRTRLQTAALESAANGIVIANREGRILWVNPAFTWLTGYSADEVLGKDTSLLKSGVHNANFYRDLWKTVLEGNVWHGEIVNRRKDGTLYNEEMTITPVRDAQGQISQFIAIKQDITERKRREQALWASEEQLKAILDNSAAVIYLKDASGRYIRANRAFETRSGFKPGQVAGKTDYDLFPKEVADKFWANDQRVVRERASLEFEESDVHEGRVRTYLSVKFPLYDTEGAPYAVAGISTEITERKQAEQALSQERDLLHALMDNISDYIYFKDADGCFVRVNKAHAQALGLSHPREAVGRTDFDFFPLDDAKNYLRDECLVLVAGQPLVGWVEKVRRADGTVGWFSSTKVPIRDSQGRITGLVGVSRDITERKHAEDALQESEERFRSFAASAQDAIVLLDSDGAISYWNEAAEKIFGHSSQEILGKKADEALVPEPYREAFRKGFLQIRPGGENPGGGNRLELTAVRKDGREFPVEVSVSALQLRKKQAILGNFRDISERKEAEAALLRYARDLEASQAAQTRHAEELAHSVEELAHERDLLRTLMDNIPDAICFKDAHGRYTRVNTAQARLLGLKSSDEAVGKTDRDFFSAEDAQRCYEADQKVLATAEPLIGNLEKRPDAGGNARWVSNTEVPVKDAQGQVTGIVGVARDVTEWRSAAEALRLSEERYRELIENASDIVYTTDLDGHMTSLNRVGRQLLGYSPKQVAELDIWQLVESKHWDLVKVGCQRLLGGETDLHMEVEVKAQDGRRVMLDVRPRLVIEDGQPVGVQGIGRDITGRDVAELELRHAQKLESVGRLASGIAHEINTPIQFVGDNTRFLQDSFDSLRALLAKYQELRDVAESDAKLAETLASVHQVEEAADCEYLLEEIPKALSQTLEGVTRVATIVRAMKEFAHPESKEMAAADLNKALQSTLTVARNELKYVADVEVELGEIPLVVCNVGDLNQVFLNLLVNAAHAIADVVKGSDEKGKIRVRTTAEGETVLIAISDTGSGIPEAIRTKVFDPFFTTKEVGRGTGQGLAIARSVVVERHRGTLTFDSEVGKGTTFFIRLPVQPPESCKEAKAT